MCHIVALPSYILVGARDGRTQFVRACLFFFPSLLILSFSFFQKILVLTLGSPPKKGERKKNTGINPGQPAEKGRKKKKPWY